jgi:DNA-binding NtrC family response regulator
MPPLWDRSEDIPDIADHFVAYYCNKYSKPQKKIRPETMNLLVRYRWPGNVRALRHAVERAVILSKEDFLSGDDFQLDEQYMKSDEYGAPAPESSAGVVEQSAFSSEDDLNLERLEQKTILDALRKNRYSISKAAKDLGLTRAALYRRMEKYGI